MRHPAVLLCLAILLLVSVVSARTWYITPDGTGDVPTIQAGVDSAAGLDTLLLADGVYTGPGNRDIVVGKPVRIISESGIPELCVMDCQGSEAKNHRGFNVGIFNPRALIQGLTVTDGWHPRFSGALDVGHAGLKVKNCRFTHNYAENGGVAAPWTSIYGEPLVFTDCVFADNSAIEGGALDVIYNDAWVECYNCTFIRNSAAYYGGAVFEYCAYVRLVRCTLVFNSALYVSHVYGCEDLRNCILAYGTGMRGIFSTYPYCCCLYQNGESQSGGEGCFEACPSFCHVGGEDFHLCDGSPCAPGNHPDGYDCGLIGAWDVGCSCGPTAAEPTTWGAIKSMYR